MFNVKIKNNISNTETSADGNTFENQEDCLAWLDKLKVIAPLEIDSEYIINEFTPTAPIEDISPRQIRMALLSLGLAENAIDGAISNLSSPQKEQAQIAWKYSTSFKRDAEAVAIIGALLSLSSEQLDQIWKVGSNI